MAYTNAWDENAPAGTALRSTMDDEIRKLKLDIRERLNAVVVDFTADPVVLQPASFNTVDKVLFFSPHGMQSRRDEDDVLWTDTYVESDDESDADMFQTIVLPVGITITRIEFLVDRYLASSITVSLRDVTFNLTPTLGTLYTVTETGTAGVKILDSGVVSITTDSDVTHQVTFSGLLGRRRYYGMKLTYTAPTLAATY